MANELYIVVYTVTGDMSDNIANLGRYAHDFYSDPKFNEHRLYQTESLVYAGELSESGDEQDSRNHIRYNIQRILRNLNQSAIMYVLTTNDNYMIDELFTLAMDDELGVRWTIDLRMYTDDKLVFGHVCSDDNSAVNSYDSFLQALAKV